MNARWLCTRLLVVAALSVAVTALALPARAADEGEKDNPAASTTQQTVTGTIEKLDASGRSLTVKGLLKSKTFEIAENAAFVAKDKPQAMLSDFKVGDRVEVTFEDQNGKLVAHRIAAAGIVKTPGSTPPTTY